MDALRLKNLSEQTGKEEKCQGGGSVGKRKLFLKGNLKGNLLGLIYTRRVIRIKESWLK